MTYSPVIGLEVHAQLKTKTKLFCNCSTEFGAEPNTQTCEVCLGFPGALPVLNKEVVNLAIKAGLACHCTIHEQSVFERKNYFYPDLPKGYQISQFLYPICTDGYLDIQVNGETKRIGITRIHIEEDAGKLNHQGADGIAGATHSLVDLNRACTPLIEIVSEPDIRSADEAKAYVEALKERLEYLDICDGNLEQGSLRVDANISLRKGEDAPFGTRTETKNLNSYRSVGRAIDFEIQRQSALLEQGEEIIQETRNFHDATGKTTSLRSKEDAHDYRYFPDPDLKPLNVSQAWIDEVKASMTALPDALRAQYISDYGLAEKDARIIVSDRAMNTYFLNCIEKKPNDVAVTDISKWLLGEYSALMNAEQANFSDPKLSIEQFLECLRLVNNKTISGKIAKELFPQMAKTGKMPSVLAKESGSQQVSDESTLDQWIQDVMTEHPDVVEKIKGGKAKSIDFLIGQIMRMSRGKANPDLLKQRLHDAIHS